MGGKPRIAPDPAPRDCPEMPGPMPLGDDLSDYVRHYEQMLKWERSQVPPNPRGVAWAEYRLEFASAADEGARELARAAYALRLRAIALEELRDQVLEDEARIRRGLRPLLGSSQRRRDRARALRGDHPHGPRAGRRGRRPHPRGRGA